MTFADYNKWKKLSNKYFKNREILTERKEKIVSHTLLLCVWKGLK